MNLEDLPELKEFDKIEVVGRNKHSSFRHLGYLIELDTLSQPPILYYSPSLHSTEKEKNHPFPVLPVYLNHLESVTLQENKDCGDKSSS